MKKLLKNIDERINVISAMKNRAEVNTNIFFIYGNALLLLGIFMGAFYYTGKLTGLEYSLRYTFYAVMISGIATIILTSILSELKVREHLELSYNPFLARLGKIAAFATQIFGLIAVVFIILMPEISKTIDVVVILMLFLISLLLQYYFERKRRDMRTFIASILIRLFISTFMFIGAITVISNAYPWIVLSIFTAYVFLLLFINALIINYKPNLVEDIGWIFLILALVINASVIFTGNIPHNDIGETDYSSNYTFNYPLGRTELIFPEANQIVDFMASDTNYYLLSKGPGLYEYRLLIYNRDIELENEFTPDWGFPFTFLKAQGNYYFEIEKGSEIYIYGLQGSNINPMGTYNSYYGFLTPLQIQGVYYLFAHYLDDPDYNNVDHTPLLLSDPSQKLDIANITDDILYQDDSDIVMRLSAGSNFFLIDSTYHYYSSFLYNNGLLRYVEPDTSQVKYVSPEEYVSDLPNVIPSENLYFIQSFAYYNGYVYELSDTEYTKYDLATGRSETAFSSGLSYQDRSGTNLYMCDFDSDAIPNSVEMFDLKADKFSMTGFVDYRVVSAAAKASSFTLALMTISASLAIVFLYKKEQ